MTVRTLVLGALAFSLASPVLAKDPPPPRGPVSIFVRARADETRPPDAEMDARKKNADALWTKFEQVERELKKTNGKDRKKWPAAAQEQYYGARETWGMAWSANYYVARPATEKSDSVADLQKHLAKVKDDAWVTLAATPEEADLIVEIVGRRGMAKFVSGVKWMGFDVLPGRVGAETLAKMPRGFDGGMGDALWVMHWPTAAEPVARLEVNHTERWSDVAKNARWALEELAKENYEVLKPSGS